MDDKTLNRDLSALLIIMVIFISVIVGLKVYDDKTGKIKELGTKIVSRYI